MTNQAAWVMNTSAEPLVVDEAPMPQPGPTDIVIKTAAVGVTSLDSAVHSGAIVCVSKSDCVKIEQYPNILGGDIAGTVHAVGSEVEGRFKEGDRVIATGQSLCTGNPANGGFQLYTQVPAALSAHVPTSMPLERAVVLPFALTTAAAGLYMNEFLGLPLPTEDPSPTNHVLLVNGASSMVGSAVTQLASASGMTVVAVVPKKDFAYVERLGARECVDSESEAKISESVEAIQKYGGFFGCYDPISSPETVRFCAEVADEFDGGVVVTTLVPPAGLPKKVKATWCSAVHMAQLDPEVTKVIWGEYIPHALKSGALRPVPEPMVVGHGLPAIQKGIQQYENLPVQPPGRPVVIL
ncbi:putative quinone oxidoreductase [Trichodelitschia bisporula]|uniref:Putative quinone oxidoreductase n=1 Tax=Trichodelitschia bisporula TaxID=703511 RepID=A0A6G1I4M6_9PEZI|nr:putative quinone oxidoreductase [Trichodelitschia bisporula]